VERLEGVQRSGRRLVNVLHSRDNVATALVELAPGTRIDLPTGPVERGGAAPGDVPFVEAQSTIPFGHKIALQRISRGQPVIKYGEVIGLATDAIAPGEHVHVHNVESQRGRGDLAAHANRGG
jgi:altronate dehydratase small subunit